MRAAHLEARQAVGRGAVALEVDEPAGVLLQHQVELPVPVHVEQLRPRLVEPAEEGELEHAAAGVDDGERVDDGRVRDRGRDRRRRSRRGRAAARAQGEDEEGGGRPPYLHGLGAGGADAERATLMPAA